MTITSRGTPSTLSGTLSFYASPSNPGRIRLALDLTGSVVVFGTIGPAMMRRLGISGEGDAVLFDRGEYTGKSTPIDPREWAETQHGAGADRVLSPGRWITDPESSASIEDQIAGELDRTVPEGTILIAVGWRFLKTPQMFDVLCKTLGEVHQPIALVLADEGDPLGHPLVAANLVALLSRIPHVSLLRTDHGGIGALAFGAAHSSIGITSSHRHFVPPSKSGAMIPNDKTPRLFVPLLMGWFRASVLAGWSTTGNLVRCDLPCCRGQDLDRFLDPRNWEEAESHNLRALADVASYVINTPADEKRQCFSKLCRDAIEHHKLVSKFAQVEKPKRQLIEWAALCPW